MASQTEIAAKIATIEATLQAGVDLVTVDGTTTRVNLDELRRERDRLERELVDRSSRRPVSSRINLGGF